MTCVREVHHYPVDAGSEDGVEPSQEYDDEESGDSRGTPPRHYEDESEDGEEPFPNGIYDGDDGRQWTYDVQINECDEPAFCGSPSERHWVEHDPPDWVEDREGSDYYSEQGEEYASENEDDYYEEGNTSYEEDEPDDDPTDESDGDY